MHRQMKRVAALFAVLAFAGCGGEEPPVDPATRAATFRWDTTVSGEGQALDPGRDRQGPARGASADRRRRRHGHRRHLAQPGRPEVGMMRPTGEHEYQVVFNLAYLNGDRKIDRNTTVLHELGHVVDFAVVPEELRDELAAQLPSTGGCITAGTATAPRRRSASPTRSPSGRCAAPSRSPAPATGWRRPPHSRTGARRWRRSRSRSRSALHAQRLVDRVVSVPCLSVTVAV